MACQDVCRPWFPANTAASSPQTQQLTAPPLRAAPTLPAYGLYVPDYIPAGVGKLPDNLQPGTLLVSITAAPGTAHATETWPPAATLSSEGFLSAVTAALAASQLKEPSPAFVCTLQTGTQATELWQQATFDNVQQLYCRLGLSQQETLRQTPAAQPPVYQCSLQGTPAQGVAAMKAAVLTVLQRDPWYTLHVSADALAAYLELFFAQLLPAELTQCTAVSQSRNVTDFSNTVFSYSRASACLECLASRGSTVQSPVCIQSAQTLPHPVVRCMSQAFAFRSIAGGGGSGGGGSTPSSSLRIPTWAIIAIAVAGAVGLIIVIAVGVHHAHQSRKRNRGLPPLGPAKTSAEDGDVT